MYYKVLIVDDEELACKGMTTFLNWEELGFTVVSTANSVAQALVYMEGNDVDLVLSDVRMPVQNGLQLLEVIREEYPDVKFIVLSAYGDFSYAQQAMRLGALDYLTKPVIFTELKDLLSRICRMLDEERSQLLSMKEYQRLRIESLLNSLAKGYLPTLDAKMAKEYALSLGGNFFVFRIRLEGIGLNHDVLNTKKKLVRELTASQMDGGNCLTFNNELREIAVLLFPKEGVSASLLAQRLSERLTENGIKAVIGISDPLQGATAIKVGYAQAGKALQYKLIKPKNRVIRFQEIDNILFWEELTNEESMMKLLELVTECCCREEALNMICNWIDSLANGGEAARNEVFALCIQIVLMINSRLNDYADEESEAGGTPYAFIRRLLLCNSVSEIKGAMEAFVDETYRLANRMEKPVSGGRIINHIKQYICEHYAEDISLNTLSEIFYVHPVYLSRLFKERTGINFIDYLTEVRIGKAKAFLRNPSYRICDVSQMVGYDSPRYFSKLFKGMAGLSPKEYRDAGEDGQT